MEKSIGRMYEKSMHFVNEATKIFYVILNFKF